MRESDLEGLIHPSRRSWIVTIATTLAGCGGGFDLVGGPPGTGGTGLFATGPISGFGSVIINSTRFDDTSATIRLNGIYATAQDLRLGMVAAIQGKVGSDSTTGVASKIEVWTIAQGQVTQTGKDALTVAGMTVKFDSATVFDGLGSSSYFPIGATVSVWGLLASGDGHAWKATRIAASVEGRLVTSGFVSETGIGRYLNGLLLTGVQAAGLSTGLFVRVAGTLDALGQSLEIVSVDAIQSATTGLSLDAGEIEGLVTLIQSSGLFTLGNTPVNATNAMISPTNAPIALGSHVEVRGSWSNGVLIASRVEVGSELERRQMTITATVSDFSSTSSFVVRGQRCDASGIPLNVKNGTITNLKLGAKIKVTGFISGDVLMVSSLEFL